MKYVHCGDGNSRKAAKSRNSQIQASVSQWELL